MTVKEMGSAIGASSPALFVGSPQIEDLVPGAVKETVIGKPYQARSVSRRWPPLPCPACGNAPGRPRAGSAQTVRSRCDWPAFALATMPWK